MASWIDDFEGNKLNPKWVVTRYSVGGQNNGVWTLEVKDSKLQFIPSDLGTESSWWGPLITLPVSIAAGQNFSVEYAGRWKELTPNNDMSQCYINLNDGVVLRGYAGYNDNWGATPGVFTASVTGMGNVTYPGTPLGLIGTSYLPGDGVYTIRCTRRNNYVKTVVEYGGGHLLGNFLYAGTLTSLQFQMAIFTTHFTAGDLLTVDYIKVSPPSVVL